MKNNSCPAVTGAAKTTNLPMRLAFFTEGESEIVVKGFPGSWGDAGWTMVEVPTAELLETMAANRQAEMPCWKEIREKISARTDG